MRIVLADDEQMVRTALRAILSSEPDLEVVGEARTGAEVLPLVRELRPDVVLMDVRMPDIDGIRATEQITRHLSGPAGPAVPAGAETAPGPPAGDTGASAVRVIVLTTFGCDSYVADALRAGAAGFLLKRAGAEDLVRAVRLVAHSDSLLFPDAVRRMISGQQCARADDGTARALGGRLSAREAEVLRHMASGLSNTEIAERLSLGPATVKSHVAAVLAKLGVRDRTQAVIAAFRSGFVTPE
ncbi:response regulator [Streptomyces sp. NPDC018031]|uniref:response regulator n=1 Tax=Streptomyces sp. NPDC018031 TaxID=3365033 RepID=UPI00379BF2E5